MEDAHIAVLDLANNADAAMFGVFDGHGGRSAATHVIKNSYRSSYVDVLGACGCHLAEELSKSRTDYLFPFFSAGKGLASF